MNQYVTEFGLGLGRAVEGIGPVVGGTGIHCQRLSPSSAISD